MSCYSLRIHSFLLPPFVLWLKNRLVVSSLSSVCGSIRPCALQRPPCLAVAFAVRTRFVQGRRTLARISPIVVSKVKSSIKTVFRKVQSQFKH